MSFAVDIDPQQSKPELYRTLERTAAALVADERDLIANCANLSALLFGGMPEVNWVGFYIVRDGELVVGPFQGKPACVRIPMGRGVCGTAAQERRTLRVDDVDAFDGHIACDADSRSEIVVPVVVAGELIAVLDVDSPVPSRFDDQDQTGLEAVVLRLVETLSD